MRKRTTPTGALPRYPNRYAIRPPPRADTIRDDERQLASFRQQPAEERASSTEPVPPRDPDTYQLILPSKGGWKTNIRKAPVGATVCSIPKGDETRRPSTHPRGKITPDSPGLIVSNRGKSPWQAKKSPFLSFIEPNLRKSRRKNVIPARMNRFFWNFPQPGQNQHKSHDRNADSQG